MVIHFKSSHLDLAKPGRRPIGPITRLMSSPSAISPVQSNKSDSRSGFALLITITLRAFLVLLLVSLASLTRVETQVASNNQQLAQARQNALMALNIALGQLQQTAGPDQRVTARAEIFDTTNPTLSATVVKQPLWTGVWKTNKPSASDQQLDIGTKIRDWSVGPGATAGTATPTTKASNTNMSWLVSGATDPTTNTTVNPVQWVATALNSVKLAAGVGSGAATVDVDVPTVPITSVVPGMGATAVPIGKYAYWVSDEGVKAKVNLKDPTYGVTPSTSFVQNQLHFLAPQAVPVNKGLLGAANTTDVRDPTHQASLSKVLCLPSLAFVPDMTLTGTASKIYSPDVTTYSYGVLADVRNGGLKRDLTSAFEDDSLVNPSGQFQVLRSSCGSGQDQESVYRANNPLLSVPTIAANDVTGSSGGSTLDGLRWQSLYQYYNLYKTTMPLWRAKTGGSAAPTGVPAGSFAAGPGVVQQRYYQFKDAGALGGSGTSGSSIPLDPLAPIVMQARVDIALESFLDSTNKYRLRLRYYPLLTLYNPYGVRITSPLATTYSFYTNYFAVNGRWNTNITVSGAPIPPFDISGGSGLVQGGGYPLKLATATADAVTFEPGEIKVFCLAADAAKTTLGDPATTNVVNFSNLKSTSPSLSADYSQYYDLPWAGTANPADVVKVTVGNRQLTANVVYLNANTTNGWPDAGNVGSNRVQVLSLPAVTPAGTFPVAGFQIGTLNGNPYRLVGFNARSKGLKATTDTNYFNKNYNSPILMGNNVSISDISGGNQWASYSGFKEVYARDFESYQPSNDVQMDAPVSGQPHHTSWGDNSAGVDPVSNTNSRRVLFDVPYQPMVSLGQFAHMPAPFYYSSSGAWTQLFLGANFVGGSLASPDTPLNQNAYNVGSRVVFDNSFMANQVLFDSFYFSTVPTANQPAADASKYPMTSAQLTTAVQKNTPLPNNRMRFYFKNGVAPSALANYLADLRHTQKAASNLLVDGAFNINSTSVEAWKALLSSLSGNGLNLWNISGATVTPFSTSDLKNPIPRFWNVSGAGAVNQPWDGMRALTDDQVKELATKIVQAVKARGPFLSMGDFLNRRLAASNASQTQMGALQEAIENTSPDINADAKAAGAPTVMPAPVAGGASFPQNTAVGMPGYLMQQDIVQAFAPAMTARSDTFVVRTYGEVLNPATGATNGKAWCEAVVQRVPDYVEQADTALTSGSNLGDATPTASLTAGSANQTFGRRFKVVLFRWLNVNEL